MQLANNINNEQYDVQRQKTQSDIMAQKNRRSVK